MRKTEKNSAVEKTEKLGSVEKGESALFSTKTADYAYNNGDAYGDVRKDGGTRENRLAALRVHSEKIKAERAERREKALEARRQAILKNRAMAEERRAKIRQERAALRREYNAERGRERLENLRAARAEKYKAEKERAELRTKAILLSRENAGKEKEARREARMQAKREKRSRGLGGWIAAVVSLACTTLLFGALFTYVLLFNADGNALLGSVYSGSYYDLTGYVDQMDVSLGKLSASNSGSEQQRILTDIAVQSSLAENELQRLPLEDSVKYSTSKYINQVGDYSKSLSRKLSEGGAIDEEDRATIREFARRNSALQTTLGDIKGEIGDNYNFNDLRKPKKGDAVIANMEKLENLSAEYPKMIYDGPFSDGQDMAEAKALTGREITGSEALSAFSALFADYYPSEQEIVNESGGKIPTYNIHAKTRSGAPLYAQMAKCGGMPVLFNCYEDCKEEVFTLEECREIAEVFVKKAGFENMKPVWQAKSRAVAQFNFAYEQDGVIVYSDLVKVNVCMERGLVSAIEATTYCMNHEERVLPSPALSQEDAISAVSADLGVASVRICLVPDGRKEKLAWEVFGKTDGGDYYIYVDAATGREIEIFRVIETGEGTVLI